jgi:hypothetical protein
MTMMPASSLARPLTCAAWSAPAKGTHRHGRFQPKQINPPKPHCDPADLVSLEMNAQPLGCA